VSNAIAISGDGRKVVAIYNDSLNQMRDLLGKPKIERASNVVWDADREIWVATRTDNGEFLCEGKDRDYVLKEEVRLLSKELITKL